MGTEDWKQLFVLRLSETANVRLSCELAGVSRATAYRHKSTDPEFTSAWREALEEATDRLEAEAWRRAVEGYERPVFQRGELVGHEKVYSDRLLEVLLKAHRPELFRDPRPADAEAGLSDEELDAEIKRVMSELEDAAQARGAAEERDAWKKATGLDEPGAPRARV